MARLPLGQLFVFGFDGTQVGAEARHLLCNEDAGGVILFRRNVESLEQVVDLNRSVIELSKLEMPHLVSVDQEGGRVARLRGICTDFPSMRAVGRAAREDPRLPQRMGALLGREMVALGFHLDFAPVVDVDTNPENPVIGERAFSEKADEVAEVAASFLRGMQESGCAACAKHFPGHGDTLLDSHLDLPVLPHEKARLDAVELVPFRAAIEAGVASIMTAHVLFPALDEEFPATLSRPILTGMMREELGFEGLIISDDLGMKALADRYQVEEMVIHGLNAGVDLFLACNDILQAQQAIEAAHRAVESGKVPRVRAEEALSRVARFKAQYVGAAAAPNLADARQILRCAPHLRVVEPFLGQEEASSRPLAAVDDAPKAP
jgi:beta-N-acetylhexosaminidase